MYKHTAADDIYKQYILYTFGCSQFNFDNNNCTEKNEKKQNKKTKTEKMKEEKPDKNRKIKYHNYAICKYMEILVAMINRFLHFAVSASGV